MQATGIEGRGKGGATFLNQEYFSGMRRSIWLLSWMLGNCAACASLAIARMSSCLLLGTGKTHLATCLHPVLTLTSLYLLNLCICSMSSTDKIPNNSGLKFPKNDR